MDKDSIIKELGLAPFGQKGWMGSPSLECPECNSAEKTGILFIKDSGVLKCMKCGYSTSLFNYFLRTNRKHLLGNIKIAPLSSKLPELRKEEIVMEQAHKINYPLGYMKIKDSDYLNGRYFQDVHYSEFHPGTAILEPHLDKEYLTFLLFKGEELVGWLARSKRSKEWHKENLRLAKLDKAKMKLRWVNAPDVEFSNILGGFNMITPETTTLILCEGLFDKIAVDRAIGVTTQNHLRCCFTFGDSISDEQIRLIKQETNVKNVIILYDFNTTKEGKAASLKLSRAVNTFVSDINWDTDPGDMSDEEILDTILDARPYLEYFTNKLNKISL